MSLDLSLFYLLNSFAGRTPFIDGTIVLFARWLPYGLAVIFAVLFFRHHYSSWKGGNVLLTDAVSIVAAPFSIIELIRVWYQRPRPFLTLPVHQLLTETSWSFPSAHATVFFAMATVVFFQDRKWGTLFYVAAALISLARVASGIHYPSDILAGACIGTLGAYVLNAYGRKLEKKK